MLRCGACRTRRSNYGLFSRHLQAHPECEPCRCSGYHFPHRRGSRMCDGNPLAGAYRASRAGCSDVEFRDIVRRITEDMQCPF